MYAATYYTSGLSGAGYTMDRGLRGNRWGPFRRIAQRDDRTTFPQRARQYWARGAPRMSFRWTCMRGDEGQIECSKRALRVAALRVASRGRRWLSWEPTAPTVARPSGRAPRTALRVAHRAARGTVV